MRGFYWGSGAVTCSFCGTMGHNVTTCKMVTIVAKEALRSIERNPSYKFTTKEHSSLNEIKRREERKKTLFKGKRKKPRCSYCQQFGHKRPKCNELKAFRLMTYQANKNWKNVLSKRINKLGLGVGSLIKINSDLFHYDYVRPNVDEIAMIIEYDYNNSNVFCALTGGNYQSNSHFKILVNETVHTIDLKHLSALLGYELVSSGWWVCKSPEVISPMPWSPTQEWLDREYDEMLHWFFRDIKKNELESSGLYSFIEKWAT